MLVKRKEVGGRPYGVAGERTGFGNQESGTEDARGAVVNVVIPSGARNSPLEIKGLVDSSWSPRAGLLGMTGGEVFQHPAKGSDYGADNVGGESG